MHLYFDVSPKFRKTEFITELGGDTENPWLQVLETLLSSHIKLCINSSTLRSLPYIFLLFLNLLHSQIMSGWPFFLKTGASCGATAYATDSAFELPTTSMLLMFLQVRGNAYDHQLLSGVPDVCENR